MGTRADFYVGKGKKAEYIGSCSMDGEPEFMPAGLMNARTEQEFRAAVANLPEWHRPWDIAFGWPWSWSNSYDTNYTYAFFDGEVFISFYGAEWLKASEHDWKDDDFIDSLYDYLNSIGKVILPSERAILRRMGLTKRGTYKMKIEHDAMVFDRALRLKNAQALTCTETLEPPEEGTQFAGQEN